ncbi:MAG TPA: Asp-tRNA(Asn)/Glu-tRNA(Gln) amidotransferase subunit GatA [Longimicrobiales bacterium]|nr:Asp-tRNA(Asn)/Glu-tRNA(Gln) amidotransferase subunit GatA [Longimicrobiales bacterium]
MSDALHRRSIAGIAGDVASGVQQATAVVRAALSDIVRCESGPDRLNAVISYDHDAAVADAAAMDRRAAAGDSALPLAGVPVAIKDNICTLGLPLTCGSRILAGYEPPYEATAVQRLRAAGAVVVGKTNLDEFAMGSSTEHSAFGPTLNPMDRGRVPGGSSGGSAAAVAAGWVPAALGSDTGGSVRQPAAFCGVVGLKPTYGRVSRYGLVAYASSLDHVGVFGRTVADAAAVLDVIAGHDPLDATSVRAEQPALSGAIRHAASRGQLPLQGIVAGVPDEYFPDWVEDGVRAACSTALDTLRELGATIRPVSLPSTRYALPSYCVLATAEASSNLARFDGVRYGVRTRDAATVDVLWELSRSAGLGAEVRRRIILGTHVLSAGYHDRYYVQAQRVRARIRHELDDVLASGIDVLFTPTTPAPAFAPGTHAGDAWGSFQSDVFTVAANLAGLPALSQPVGRSGGLPVGGQLIASRWREDVLVRVAAALETGLAA